MKIIGTTKGGFILEASENELANLTGYYSEYQRRDKAAEKELKVGDTIMVSEMYHRLYVIARRRGEIKTAQKMLLDAASELELVDPIIAASEDPKVEQPKAA
jgi:RNA polymerase-interacting CarD/CdnL/TRCF family regulator